MALLDELLPLLAQSRFDAIAVFKRLEQLLAGTAVAAEMTQASQQLGELRFDLTMKTLQQIAASQGWPTAAAMAGATSTIPAPAPASRPA